jgi:hypothetical protein
MVGAKRWKKIKMKIGEIEERNGGLQMNQLGGSMRLCGQARLTPSVANRFVVLSGRSVVHKAFLGPLTQQLQRLIMAQDVDLARVQ